MKKSVLALMLVLGCCGIGFAQKSKQATAQEKKDLFQLILKDKNVREALTDLEGGELEGGEKELAKSFSVEKKDLNKDAQPEYLATLDNGFLCGAHANCPRWVFRKTGNGYRLLLTTAGEDLTTQKTLSNKFFDLRSEGSNSAVEYSYSIYKFDGSEYQKTDCFTVNNEKKKPKTTRVQCQEWRFQN